MATVRELGLAVKFYGLDDGGQKALIGILAWDGLAWWCSKSSPWLSSTLEDVVLVPVGDKLRRVTSRTPTEFLAGLHYQYKSAYMAAGLVSPYDVAANVDSLARVTRVTTLSDGRAGGSRPANRLDVSPNGA
jgi:hypothetical protein